MYPLGRYSGFTRRQRETLDAAFDILEGSSLPSGMWTPANLTTPPKVWFETDERRDLLTLASASSTLTTATSMFNSGTYSGTATGVSVQHRNPQFGNHRTIVFTGVNNTKLVITGGLGLIRNKNAATLIYMGRHLQDSWTANASAGSFVYFGTNVDNEQRIGIGRSVTAANVLRVGGRRVDGSSFSGNDVGGNLGSSPFLIIATFDAANAVRNTRINGTQVETNVAWQNAGTFSNTNSFYAGFGASATGSGVIAAEMYAGGVHDGTFTTTEQEKIEGYLYHQAGRADLLPAAHPYKAAAPTV